MSRSIRLVATYLNGKKAMVGLYCPKNADMVESTITAYEYKNIVSKLFKDLKGRNIKSGVEIQLNRSTSDSNEYKYHTFKISLTSLKMTSTINHVVEFLK